MRILLATGSFPPLACGVGDYTRALAAALADAGLEVAVLTSVEADEQTAPCQTFRVMRAWKDDEFPLVQRVVREWRPDIVHVQYPTQGYRGRLPRKLPMLLGVRGTPVVQTWHEHVPLTGKTLDVAIETLRDLPALMFGRDVIAVRPDFLERLPRWFRLLTARKRYHLIPNAPSLPRVVVDEADRSSIRERWGVGRKKMLAFFGFCYEHKGIDDALAAMDPSRDHLVIVGRLVETDPYQADLLRRLREPPLTGHVTIAGFLSPEDAARTLAAADAVVLPFRTGGGSWNTSLKAAALQGSFVLTTSTHRHGYDADANVYWARPRDPADLAAALGTYLGRRIDSPSRELSGPDWHEIARRHIAVYGLNT
jgi:glycosyltransferase involved in cell wall biosynthesis